MSVEQADATAIRVPTGQVTVAAAAGVCSLGLAGYFADGYLTTRHWNPAVPRTVLAAADLAAWAPAVRFAWLFSMALGLALLVLLVLASPRARGAVALLSVLALGAVGLSLRLSPAWPTLSVARWDGPGTPHAYVVAAVLAAAGALLYAAQVLVVLRQRRGSRAS